MDFLEVKSEELKSGIMEVYPEFHVKRSNDLMIRGSRFYAIWDEENQRWSTDYYKAIELIDREIMNYLSENKDGELSHYRVHTKWLWQFNNKMVINWRNFCEKALMDNYKPLDENLVFSNQQRKREDFSSKNLSYPLEKGPTEAWDSMMSVLYEPDELHKIEWSIGAIVTGASKTLQKFIVLYGAPGTGKGTVLKILEDMLFKGYCASFDAATLASASNPFALEQLKTNPLVAVCPDGDLSKIEKNTTLNSLISHETLNVNEKHKSVYEMRFNTFLWIGSNSYVKITDAKSGLIRRLIDVHPTEIKIPKREYDRLFKAVEFELGHIAYKCMEIFNDNPNAYDDYIPVRMMSESNTFFNFIEDNFTLFRNDDGTSLKAAWDMYKMYVEDAKIQYSMNRMAFKNELMNYFRKFEERAHVGDEYIRSYYSGFKTELFETKKAERKKKEDELKAYKSVIGLKEQPSILDIYCEDCPAQYGSDYETPKYAWDNVTTKLKDIDTKKLHYLKVPLEHIVIDFDLKDENGNKSLKLNEKAASEWPSTYAETSKGGSGIHLHYIWDGGDPTLLSRIYSNDVEIKVFTGKSSLRRKVKLCNNVPIAHLSSGLPLREKKMAANFTNIANEKALRTIIKRNLMKEFGSTKCSIDFIFNSLEDAYNSDLKYDVSDLKNAVVAFAASSTHQSEYCIKLVTKMHFASENASEYVDDIKEIVFFDVEVFKNLFIINWKKLGKENPVNRLINPTPDDVKRLLRYRLVGFNNRNYDNHMLYARMQGYSNRELYELSQNIIKNGKGKIREAYNISYTDIYDYSSKKMSLKKWEIKLGILHMELGLSWDEEVPEELWEKVAEYCDNDVISTEAVWDATNADFKGREILADISNMTVNDTTNSLTTKFIFGNEKKPQLVYVNLEDTFPGYHFEKKWRDDINKYERHNWYRDIDLGFGGYVYAVPGVYGNVALLDVASLHPHSIKAMNCFGDYTRNFVSIMDARIFIKHKEYDKAKQLFDGKLAKYLDDPSSAKQLSQALKIAINSVYGLTSAGFDNPFKDPRNENNIVALRGALFMKTLQDEVTARGFKVVHIKTDSIKIADATTEIINFCMEFAKQYGYTFEHEATYERICLVNDAVYIAKYATEDQCRSLYGKKYYDKDPETCAHNKEEGGTWTATGTQFQVPYVFKKCFSHEDIKFEDMCETKEVKTAMYLDMNESLGDEHMYRFIGRVGLFCPIKPGYGGGELVKDQPKKDGTIGKDSVTGAKGWRWLEATTVRDNNLYDSIDCNFYNNLVDEAKDTINQYIDYNLFVSDKPYQSPVYINGVPDYEATKYLPF